MCKPELTNDCIYPGKDIKEQCNGSPRKFSRSATVLCSLIIVSLFLRQAAKIDVPRDCIYVPGGGHGAILFHYAQLDRILLSRPRNMTNEIYCSSAGCLSSVFALSGLPRSAIQDIYEKSYERADANSTFFASPGIIVEQAIDEFVSRLDEQQLQRTSERLNVLTTTVGIGLNVRKPQNATHLKDLLRQSSWIPLLTADGLYAQDEEGSIHLDGDFLARIFPPKCAHSMSTPFFSHPDLIWHLFIPVRSVEMMSKLMHNGFLYQLKNVIKTCTAPLCLRGLPRIKSFNRRC